MADPYKMVRRAADAGIMTKVGNHTFRSTGILSFTVSAERREFVVRWKPRNRWRTTPIRRPTALYDRSDDEVSFDEAERIVI